MSRSRSFESTPVPPSEPESASSEATYWTRPQVPRKRAAIVLSSEDDEPTPIRRRSVSRSLRASPRFSPSPSIGSRTRLSPIYSRSPSASPEALPSLPSSDFESDGSGRSGVVRTRRRDPLSAVPDWDDVYLRSGIAALERDIGGTQERSSDAEVKEEESDVGTPKSGLWNESEALDESDSTEELDLDSEGEVSEEIEANSTTVKRDSTIVESDSTQSDGEESSTESATDFDRDKSAQAEDNSDAREQSESDEASAASPLSHLSETERVGESNGALIQSENESNGDGERISIRTEIERESKETTLEESESESAITQGVDVEDSHGHLDISTPEEAKSQSQNGDGSTRPDHEFDSDQSGEEGGILSESRISADEDAQSTSNMPSTTSSLGRPEEEADSVLASSRPIRIVTKIKTPPPPSPPNKSRSGKRPKPEPVSREYTSLLNEEIRAARTREGFGPDDTGNITSVVGSSWTARERNNFFRTLTITGIDDATTLSRAVGTKSIVECRAFLQLLADTSAADHERIVDFHETRGPVTAMDVPAAVELSEACITALDKEAAALERRRRVIEESEEKRKWGEKWVVDQASAEHLDDLYETEEIEALQSIASEAELLNASKMLELSEMVFMNSTKWGIWHEVSETPPQIRYQAFSDLHTLAVSFTRRVVQTTIYMAQARVRALETTNVKFSDNPEVTVQDIETALRVMDFPTPSGRDWWVDAPRRCGVSVISGKHCKVFGRYKKIPYDKLETILSGVGKDGRVWNKMPDFSESENDEEEDVEDDNSIIVSSPPEELEASEPGEEEAAAIHSDAEATFIIYSDSDTDTVLLSTEQRKLRKKAIAAEEVEEAYINTIDARSSRATELQLWNNVLGVEATLSRPEDEAPRAPPRQRKRKFQEVDWRADITTAAEWQSKKPCLVAGKDPWMKTQMEWNHEHSLALGGLKEVVPDEVLREGMQLEEVLRERREAKKKVTERLEEKKRKGDRKWNRNGKNRAKGLWGEEMQSSPKKKVKRIAKARKRWEGMVDTAKAVVDDEREPMIEESGSDYADVESE